MAAEEQVKWICEKCNTESLAYELIPDSEVEIIEAWGRQIPITTKFNRCPHCGSDEDLLEIKHESTHDWKCTS